MSDQCRHCTACEDLEVCLLLDCSHHESWYAKQQAKRIAELKKDNAWLESRDGNATVQLIVGCGEHPFNKVALEVVDFRVSDNCYVVRRKKGKATK